MLIKANLRTGLRGRADYLLRNKANERVRPLEVRGLIADDDFDAAYYEMTDIHKKHKNPFISMSINPSQGDDHTMTEEQWLRALEIIDERTGLSRQPRISVIHEKRGQDGQLRTHLHADWCRVKDNGRLVSDSNLRHKLVQAKIQMELEFGHTRTKDYDRKEYAIAKRIEAELQAQGRTAQQIAENAQEVVADAGKKPSPPSRQRRYEALAEQYAQGREDMTQGQQKRFDRIADAFAANNPDLTREQRKQEIAEQRKQEENKKDGAGSVNEIGDSATLSALGDNPWWIATPCPCCAYDTIFGGLKTRIPFWDA